MQARTAQTSGTLGAVPRLALRPSEAAIAIGCSDDFFRAHIAAELAWVRRGRLRVVSLIEIQRFLDENAEHVLETTA